jgi:hypothetical protein
MAPIDVGNRSLKDTVVRSLLVLASLAALAYSVILIAAGCLARQQTPAALNAAVRLVPFNADYLISLAELEPERAGILLREAVKRNPFIGDVWIRLALRAELQGRDRAGAERDYLQAARVDHMYMPRWTLANFYLRRHDENKFFAAAKSALEITPYSSAPLFSEAYALNANDEQVMRMIPQRPEVAFSYLQFVLASNRVSALEPAALKAAGFRPSGTWDESGDVSNWTTLLGATGDRLISLNRFEAALRVSNRMHESGWVQMPPPSASAPLTNAFFRFPISGHGFDWTLYPAPGVTADQMPESQKLRFTLSGTQPEQCRLLQQVVILQPGLGYRFTWQAESSDFQSAIGLTWKLSPLAQTSGAESPNPFVGPDLFPAGGRNAWSFTVPPRSQAFLLTLELKRPLGQVRAEGTFAISDLSLTRVLTRALAPGREPVSNISVRGFAKP